MYLNVFLDENKARIFFFRGEELKLREKYQEEIIRRFGFGRLIEYERKSNREEGTSYVNLE